MKRLLTSCLVLATLGAAARCVVELSSTTVEPRGVLPAEFDPQEAIILSAPGGIAGEYHDVLADIVSATHIGVDLFVIVGNEAEARSVREQLAGSRIRDEWMPNVITSANRWARDAGPLCLRGEDAGGLLVQIQQTPAQHQRTVSSICNLESVTFPDRLEVGKLTTNGRGLFLTTEAEASAVAGEMSPLHARFREYLGATQIVHLEPLRGEPTRFVSAFATFVSPTVVWSPKFRKKPIQKTTTC